MGDARRSLWEAVNSYWPSIVGLFTAAVLGLLSLPALDSSRPPTGVVRPLDTIGVQDVSARLWQDPLTVLGGHSSEDPHVKELHDVTHLQNQLRQAERAVLILPVMFGGGPYAEDHESRIRTRMAVVSALGRAHYVPQDGEHVGFFTIAKWPRTDPAGSTGANKPPSDGADKWPSMPLTIPYEWWQVQGLVGKGDMPSGDVRPERVLILWVRDEAMSDWPLMRTAMLLEELGAERDQLWFNRDHMVRVLGPRRSGTLRNMVLESASNKVSGPVRKRLSRVEFYSGTATAADSILTYNSGVESQPAEVTIRQKGGPSLIRTLATDDMLCDALIEELRLRGVDVRSGRNAIALVSEWDTLYGRALPLTFAARAHLPAPANPGADQSLADARMREQIEQQLASTRGFSDNRIIQFSYLRGLDGVVPGQPPALRRPEGRAGTPSLQDFETARQPREVPEGLNQADYLRRLADVLVRRDRLLRGLSGNGPGAGSGLAAVGILGSDSYDKLMVLRALRPHLPAALFFTTDLDLRVAHPLEWSHAHNLIVASSYGLRLRGDLQMDIPPFRDGYQTALFYSALRALEVLGSPGGPPATTAPAPAALEVPASAPATATTAPAVPPPPAARIFEVSRRGPRDLSLPSTQPSAVVSLLGKAEQSETIREMLGADAVDHRDGVHPSPTSLIPWWAYRPSRWLLAGSVWIFSLALLTLHVGLTRGRLGEWRALLRPAPLLLLSIPAIIVLVVSLSLLNTRHDEPLALFDGISIWPSIGLRMLAVVVGIVLLLKGAADLRANELQLHETFGVAEYDDAVRLMDRPIHAVRTVDRWKVQGSPVNANQLWKEYLRLGAGDGPVGRIAVASAGYLLAALGIFFIFGFPRVPYRGYISLVTDRTVLVVAVIVLIVLIFFVVDATRLCQRFIDNLVSAATKWPAEVTRREAEAHDLKQADVDESINVRFIAARTAAVGRLILFPFVVLLLLVLARLKYFDNFDWPLSLIIVFVGCFLYAALCQWVLYSAAARARRISVDRLKQQIAQMDREKDAERIAKMQGIVKEVEALHEGAFAPITQQPLAAVLLSTGGLALWQLLVTWLT